LVTLAVAAVARVVVMLGYRWQLWFPDSFGYVNSALGLRPGLLRPSGYSLLLRLLRPLGGFAPVTALQHLMGLGMGAMVYAVLRRNGLSGRVATLAAVPVLFDAYELQLEHLVLSDTLFAFLVTGAVTAMLWRYEVTGWRAAAAALLLGLSAIVRTVGLPLIALVVAFLLLRRVRWRVLAVAVIAGVLPVVAYAGWYKADRGRFALGDGTGIFMYARTLSFADCARIDPPPDERPLCPVGTQRNREPSFVWNPQSPIKMMPGKLLTRRKERLALSFAVGAVHAQPLDFLAAIGADIARTFQPGHPPYPSAPTYSWYLFPAHPAFPSLGGASGVDRYAHGSHVTTRAVAPYSTVLRVYQRYVYLPGILLGLIMLFGAVAMAGRRRRFGGRMALPWGMAAALIVLPVAGEGFDYRYVLPAVPSACLAAALAVRFGIARMRIFGMGRTLDVRARPSDRE
jgi:hypothetical protein